MVIIPTYTIHVTPTEVGIHLKTCGVFLEMDSDFHRDDGDGNSCF